MNKQKLIELAISFLYNSAFNVVSEEMAISQNTAGLRMYEPPIFGFASASDPYFELLKQPQALGEHFMLPQEWLPEAKTVISMFLPFTEKVKKSNKKDMSWPSEEWLHARIEGQVFINKLCEYLNSELKKAGYNSVVPALDKRFWSKTRSTDMLPDWVIRPENIPQFTSNWSERHVAFGCGLGTFGLSKGLITKKGVAGRIGSIITELYLTPDKREYEEIYEYCNTCGACAKNCPVNAISIEKGKDHTLCSNFLDITTEKYKPRYGCGKCQVKVPCENGIPN